jgi:hypothetical protein
MKRTHRNGLSWLFGLLLVGGNAAARVNPDGPPEPGSTPVSPVAASNQATMSPVQKTPAAAPTNPKLAATPANPSGKKQTAEKTAQVRKTTPPRAAPTNLMAQAAPRYAPSGPDFAAEKVTLKLAPSAAEIQNERRNAPLPPTEQQTRDATPKQDQRWPTHVDYTRGPGSSLGAGTSGDRKGMMEDASGPQQEGSVIRNRW